MITLIVNVVNAFHQSTSSITYFRHGYIVVFIDFGPYLEQILVETVMLFPLLTSVLKLLWS